MEEVVVIPVKITHQAFEHSAMSTGSVCDIQDVFKKKKDRPFAIKTFILQHFKHCPLQSSPLCWRYTVPNVSSIVGTLPGTHFL